MTAGEINYDAMFHLSFSEQGNGERELAFLPVAYIMLIPFIVKMPILFLNMLVSCDLIFLLYAQIMQHILLTHSTLSAWYS